MRAGCRVVLDACVLIPMPLADTLLRMAERPGSTCEFRRCVARYGPPGAGFLAHYNGIVRGLPDRAL